MKFPYQHRGQRSGHSRPWISCFPSALTQNTFCFPRHHLERLSKRAAGGADTRRFPQTVGTLWKFRAALGAAWPVARSAGRPRGPFGTVWKFTQNVWPHTVTYLTSPRRGLALACELCRRWNERRVNSAGLLLRLVQTPALFRSGRGMKPPGTLSRKRLDLPLLNNEASISRRHDSLLLL